MSFSRTTGSLLGFLLLFLISLTGHEPLVEAKAVDVVEVPIVKQISERALLSAASQESVAVTDDILEELTALTLEWSELPVDQIAVRLNNMSITLPALDRQIADMERVVVMLENPEEVTNWNMLPMRMLLVGIGDWQGMYDEDIQEELKKGPQDLPLTAILIEARVQIDAHRKERLLKQLEKVHLEAHLRRIED
jgi:hypothetical protein